MEEINENPILTFNKNQLHEVRKLYSYKSADDVNRAVDCLDDWIEKQNHFVMKKFDRTLLERLLLASKGSLERTKKHLDKLCTSRTLSPDFLKNFNIPTEFENYFKVTYNAILRKPSPDNYRICVVKTLSDNYDKFSLLDFFRYNILMIEYIKHFDYSLGTILILDFKHINFSLVSKINPVTIEKGRSIIVDGYGVRVKAIYIINSSKMIDTFVTMVKQGLSEKLRNRLHTLSSPEDLQKHIPKDILPSDYGGKEPSIQELHERTFKAFCSETFMNKVKEMENAATDESLRDAYKFNEEILGMPGSFKSLNVD